MLHFKNQKKGCKKTKEWTCLSLGCVVFAQAAKEQRQRERKVERLAAQERARALAAQEAEQRRKAEARARELAAQEAKQRLDTATLRFFN